MSLTALKISLNRAHKIETRLGTMLRALRVDLTTDAVCSRFSHRPREEQVEVLQRRLHVAKETLNQIEELTTIRTQLRQIIGVKNAEVGVSSLLAQIESAQRLISDYEALEAQWSPSPEDVHLSLLTDIEWPETGQGLTSRASAVSLTAVTLDDVKMLQDRKKELIKAKFRLMDELSELNTALVEIAISEHWARELGLI